jgi:hypothetical protein
MKKAFFILICIAGFLYCCNNNSSIVVDGADGDDLVEDEMILEDTLRLEEGKIPEEWVKVFLKDGYYIGFPKQPRKKESKSNQRVEYKLKRSQYRLYSSLTDLSKELSFQENKKYRSAYYHAIIDDLSEDLEAKIEYEQTFYSQNIYEGIRATIVAEDVRIYIQCIIIESTLFTISLTLFKEESPAYLQMKDKFFYSFGNEFYKSKKELDTQDRNNVKQN